MLKNMFVFCCRSCCGKGHQHLSYSLPVGHIRRHDPDIALPVLFTALLLQVCLYLTEEAQTNMRSILFCDELLPNVELSMFLCFQEEVFPLAAHPQEVHSILHSRCF